jgi:hypothetical protein
VLPPIVQRRIENARAVSANLRSVARENEPFPALAARYIQAAQTIDELAALLESMTLVAKLNHDTIKQRESA